MNFPSEIARVLWVRAFDRKLIKISVLVLDLIEICYSKYLVIFS